MNPSFCNLLQSPQGDKRSCNRSCNLQSFLQSPQGDNLSLATTALLAKLDRKKRDRWSEAVRSIDFSHSSRKAWSIMNNLTGCLQHSPLHSVQSLNYCISASQKREIRGCLPQVILICFSKKCLTFRGPQHQTRKYL